MDELITLREAQNAKRMRHFVPAYLEPLLSKDWDIVSIGCGSGIDVEMLRQHGYRAYGFDPGRDAHFALRDDGVRAFLRTGGADDRPFGDQRFDFAYALEVIEHVGCWEFGTRLRPSWRDERLAFLKSSLALLRSPGRLLLSTSNRLCPIDPGHDHRYSVVGGLAAKLCLPFGISVPWHPRNFLYSFGQLVADIRTVNPRARVATASIGKYPAITGRRGFVGKLAKGVLASIDFDVLRRSPAAPLLVAMIEV